MKIPKSPEKYINLGRFFVAYFSITPHTEPPVHPRFLSFNHTYNVVRDRRVRDKLLSIARNSQAARRISQSWMCAAIEEDTLYNNARAQ